MIENAIDTVRNKIVELLEIMVKKVSTFNTDNEITVATTAELLFFVKHTAYKK